MERQSISSFYASTEQLLSNKVLSLDSDTDQSFYLETGDADVFYIEKLPTGSGRRLFLFRVNAPFLVPGFPVNDSFSLVINALTNCTIGVLDSDSLSRLMASIPDYAIYLFEKWFITLSTGFNYFGTMPLLNGLSAMPVFSADPLKSYSASNSEEVLWIESAGLKPLYYDFADPIACDLQLLPLTSHLWMSFGATAQKPVLTTSEAIKNDTFLPSFFGFNKLIVTILHKLYKREQDVELAHVKATYAFRNNAVFNALARFRSIITGKGSEVIFGDEGHQEGVNDPDAHPDMLLYQTCQLIGKEEKIEFVDPGNRISGKHDYLWNILRASTIRSRMVTLEQHWWTNNAGSMLGFLKADQTPVGLIAKGNTGYWMIDLKNRKKERVHESINNLLDSKAYSFFTPFPKGKLQGRELIRFALQFTYRDIINFMVVGIIGALLALIIPVVGGYVFNNVIPGGDTGELWQIGAIMIICVITIGLLNFAKSIAVLRMAGKAGYKLQSALWDRILSLKVDFFRNYSPGNLAERSMGIERIRDTLSTNVLGALISSIFSVFYLALLFFYDLKLALLALILGLVVAGFTLTISLLAYKHVVFMRRMDAMISGFLLMAIRGINKIRVTGSKEKVFSIWAERYSQQKDHYRQKRILLMVASIFTVTFPVLASMLIFIRVYTIFRSGMPGFGIGDFVAFNSAYLSFQGAMIQTFMVTVPLLNIKPTYQLFQPILEAETEDMNEKLDPGELTGSLEITHLSFRYPDSPDWSLKDLSMNIHPGQFVAITGSSGSGKSTLVRLLLGFEKYDVGSILFDNKELKDLDIRGIRDQLGVVLQNSRIMEGTVLYNIRGSSLYSEEDAWKAAEMAGCADEIMNLPNKMHTLLPPGGDILSGGQQQRIIIARALIRNPKIFIFDEATSALDNETQGIVSASIEKLNATRIVIAHRLSTIINADHIFVLDKGQLIEEGSYKELIEKNGFFAELTRRQLA
ncbi:MAG: NHLP bacteriocin export ABC transporter permease/ATPase subunit [Bacteroidetes bacterium]|nr:NHLP bacteriocin export ABC transporter permease/ATPase subunit [Bacteroidota bacterium]